MSSLLPMYLLVVAAVQVKNLRRVRRPAGVCGSIDVVGIGLWSDCIDRPVKCSVLRCLMWSVPP